MTQEMIFDQEILESHINYYKMYSTGQNSFSFLRIFNIKNKRKQDKYSYVNFFVQLNILLLTAKTIVSKTVYAILL